MKNNSEEQKRPGELGLEHLELFPVQLSSGFKVQSKDLPKQSAIDWNLAV